MMLLFEHHLDLFNRIKEGNLSLQQLQFGDEAVKSWMLSWGQTQQCLGFPTYLGLAKVVEI